MSVQEVLRLWEELDKLAHPYLAPIETERHYQEALDFMAELWDVVVDDPNSPYGSLLGILSDRLNDYENSRHAVPEATPQQVLSYLIEEKGVTQKEIEEATGIYQSNLSQILSGKRKLTTEQVKQLAEYFKVNPTALL
ncbi:MAG: helix-turn-helix domain-containing protein [Trueperaceae bacterium]|nr:MAG: helix-turn-helix domain-containing protein [Trueperaceae bacterium]